MMLPIAVWAVIENLLGALRFFVGDSERADSFAAVADLVPVIVLVLERFAGANAIEPRINPLGCDRILNSGAVAGRQSGVEPVVTDAQCGSHLAGGQEDRGIPIGKRGGGEHLLCGAIGEAPVSAQAIEAGQGEDAAFHVARFIGEGRARRRSS